MKIDKMFSVQDKAEIREAIKSVERVTSGEIVPVIVSQSSSYKTVELYFSMFISLFFTSVSSMFIHFTGNFLAYYVFLTFAGFIFGILIFKVRIIRSFVVPKHVKYDKVQQTARRNFFEHSLYRTKHKTGILIYVSLFERQVVVLGDEGINSKIEQHDWDNVVKLIIQGIKNSRIKDGIIAGIKSCSEMLHKFFPIHADDVNELSNDVIIK